MPAAAQTPTAFLKAAAKQVLQSDECKKALAACGYTPEDFGSYTQVLKRCGAARKATGGARTQGSGLEPGQEKKGTDRQKWLAECQSGHLSENNRHQTDREHNSGSHCPLYDSNNAPCMPHAGMAGHANTQHGAVTNTDIESARAANAEPGPGGTMGIDRERAATKAATKAALDWGMDSNQPVAPQMRAERFAAIRAINAQGGAAGTLPKEGAQLTDAEIEQNYKDEKDKAMKCIEAFFDAQWKVMASQTQARKKAAAANSEANQKRAQSRIDALEKKDPRSEKEEAALAKARSDLQKAKDAPAEYEKVKDLDPTNVDGCMGMSKPSADRAPMIANDPTDPPVTKPKKKGLS